MSFINIFFLQLAFQRVSVWAYRICARIVHVRTAVHVSIARRGTAELTFQSLPCPRLEATPPSAIEPTDMQAHVHNSITREDTRSSWSSVLGENRKK